MGGLRELASPGALALTAGLGLYLMAAAAVAERTSRARERGEGGALPAAAPRSRGSTVLSAGRWIEGRRRKAAAAAGALPQLCACAPWAGACARSAADALGACSADALAYTQLAATLQTVSTIRTSSRA